jgi:hypothetical protein
MDKGRLHHLHRFKVFYCLFLLLLFLSGLQFIAKVSREYNNFFPLIQATVRYRGTKFQQHCHRMVWQLIKRANTRAGWNHWASVVTKFSTPFQCKSLSILGWKMKLHEETTTIWTFFCRWPALCASVIHPPTCRRCHLSSVQHGVVQFFHIDLHLTTASTDYCYDTANSLYRPRLTCWLDLIYWHHWTLWNLIAGSKQVLSFFLQNILLHLYAWYAWSYT